MTSKLFSELGISAEVLKAIDKLGFEQATPIQAEAIPTLLKGLDVVGQSQTGSGKTAAFGIPAIEKVDPSIRAVQILILSPTRELAVQVSEEIHKLAFFKRGIHALPIYGGQSYERQFYGLKQGAQIVIGTPGRLMDHMRRGTLQLNTIKMVVLDEADVMLDMGFRDDIEFILQAMPPERQTVFFSATMPKPIQDLIRKYSKNAENIRMEQKTMTVPTVEQSYYEVDRRFKIELLTRLIDIHDLKLGIIFCNTKRMVDELVDHLNAQGYSADRLHGDMSQAMRDRVMSKFRKSGLEFLVATDVAARGIDVDDVQVVFNYDLPYDVEDYVHRIGRTGRAGRSGLAISFVAGREVFQIQQIERYTKMKVQRLKVPTADQVEEARTNTFLDKIRTTLKSGEFKRHDHLIERLLEEGFSTTDVAAAALFHLQGGEAAAAPAPAPAPARDRDFEDRSERQDRGSFRDQREERGGGGYRQRDEERGRPSFREGRESYSDRPAQRRDDRPTGLARPTASQPAKFVTPPAPRPVAPATKPAAAAKPIAVAKPEAIAVPAPAAAAPSAPAPRALPFPDRRPATGAPAKAAAGPKKVKAPAENQTRIFVNVGEEMGVGRGDVLTAIQGETGLPATVVGNVDIRERHLFMDVEAEHTQKIIAKLNRSQIKGHKVKVKIA